MKSAQLGTIRTKLVPAFVLFCCDVIDQLCALCFCHADNQGDHRRESAASKAPDCSNCETLAKVRQEIQAKNTNVTTHKVWKLQHTKALLFLLTPQFHMSLNISTKLNTSLQNVLICQCCLVDQYWVNDNDNYKKKKVCLYACVV